MSTSLTREQKVEFILAIRGIGIADNFIRSEYKKMLDDELQVEFDFYVTNFNQDWRCIMKTGFIFGLLTALAVSVPVMLADHMAIIPGSLVFLSGILFGISVRKFFKGESK
jgi:hypothetical protein